jgi:hypothetical protein
MGTTDTKNLWLLFIAGWCCYLNRALIDLWMLFFVKAALLSISKAYNWQTTGQN